MNKRKTANDDDDNFPTTLALPLDELRSGAYERTAAQAPKPRVTVRAPLSPELMAKYSLGTPRAPAPAGARRGASSKFDTLAPAAAAPTSPARKASTSKFASLEPEPPVARKSNSKFAPLEPAAPAARKSNSKFAPLEPAAPAARKSNSKFAPLDPATAPRAPAVAEAGAEAPRGRQTTAAGTAAASASDTPPLRLVVRGFSAVERSLLDGTVKLSQRRTPRLKLLADSEVNDADVVMINALDARAMDWAQRQTVLSSKAVIWVDGSKAAPGHTLTKRPVQWPILPILLARALEQGPGSQTQAQAPAPDAAADGAATAPAAVSDVPRPILVVDDSLAVRAHLRSQLEARGHQVVEAENVEGAIQAVSGTAFACVLMDVLMPGADGYEGCKQIKAKLRGALSVPVVMLTSKSSPFDRIRGKMAGCDAYLTKPVEAKQLHDTLAPYVVARAGAAPAEPKSPARAGRRTNPAPLELHDAVEP
jgi:two-component system, cell cycle response regulator